MKEIIDKRNFINIKNFSVKENVKKIRGQATDCWENTCKTHIC